MKRAGPSLKRASAADAPELHLGIEETLFAGAQLLFRPLSLADIAAHVLDIYRLASSDADL